MLFNPIIMKKLYAACFILGIIFLQGCEGPAGPQGPPGQDGEVIASSAFELEGVSFNSGNDYSIVEEYGFEVLPSDVVLVYILWETDGNEIWRLLPQTVFLDGGILQYNYDFTLVDVSVFLDGTIDFSILDSEWTTGQILRFVVVPADFVDARMDFSDYEAVTRMLGLEEEDFQRRK